MQQKIVINIRYIMYSDSGSAASSKSGYSSSKSEKTKKNMSTSVKNTGNKKSRRRASSELQPVMNIIFLISIFKF